MPKIKNDSIQRDIFREKSVSPLRNPLKELQLDINGLLSTPEFTNAQIGVSILAIETGEFVYRKDDEKNFIPASLQKLLTAATALDKLGADFRFVTRIYLDGYANRGGEFVGNIHIRGSGDPTFSSYFYRDPSLIFESLAKKFDTLGIKSIRGNIIADVTYFDDRLYPDGWVMEDIPFGYAPPISALNFSDNSIDLTIYSGKKIKEKAKISINPDYDIIEIKNNIYVADSTLPSTIAVYRQYGNDDVVLSGTIPQNTSLKQGEKILISTPDPKLYFCTAIRELLQLRGIKIRGSILNSIELPNPPNYPKLLQIWENYSPPLSEIVVIANRYSHNLCAESLLKTIAKEITGKGIFEVGCEIVKQNMLKHGVNSESIVIKDGSGLSRLNAISPSAIVKFLASMYRTPLRDKFTSSLAIPGERGTLQKRMKNSRAEKNVAGKTGAMNGVSNLCGYAVTRDKETLAFAIMMNGITAPSTLAQSLQDLICMRIASFSRK